MADTNYQQEAEIVELLFKASYEIKTLMKQNEYIKARAFEMLSGMDLQQKIAIYDPYPLADQCDKLATFLQMKNTGKQEPQK